MVTGTELRSASMIFVDMFVMLLKKAFGGRARVVIFERTWIGAREVVKHARTVEI